MIERIDTVIAGTATTTQPPRLEGEASMNEYVIPTPTPQEIDKAVANVRSLLQLHDHLLRITGTSDLNRIFARIESEEKCKEEVNSLMSDWVGDCRDQGLIIDRLTGEVRADLFLMITPGCIYPDTMHKLLHAVEQPKGTAA
jgi:hypothetical protein